MHRSLPKRKLALAAADYLVLNLSFAVAVWYRTVKGVDLVRFTPWPQFALELWYFAALSVTWLGVFAWSSLYHINVFLSVSRQLALLSRALLWCLGVYVAVSFLVFRGMNVFASRLIMIYLFVLSFATLAFVRLFIFRPVYATLMRRTRVPRKRVAIVGTGEAACAVATRIMTELEYGLKVVGFVSDDVPAGTEVFQGLRCLGGTDRLRAHVDAHRVARLIVAPEAMPAGDLVELVRRCRAQTHVSIQVISRVYDTIAAHYGVEELKDRHLIPVARNRRAFAALKRAADVAGAAVALVALSPLLGAIALAIRLTSAGPVIFRQERVGKGGRRFNFLKFRTMRLNNDAAAHEKFVREFIAAGSEAARVAEANAPAAGDSLVPRAGTGPQKIVNDPRVTTVGRWLRKLSLDELPQLWNVLRGDMSLVGPRPCLPYEFEAYQDWHKQRLSVTPGCTGFWQVYGRSRVDFHDMVVMDLFYIDNMSPWLDLVLLLKTLPVMLLGKGAH